MENKIRKTLAVRVIKNRVIGDIHLALEEVVGIGVSPRYEIIKGMFDGENQIGGYIVLGRTEIDMDQVENCLVEAFNKYLDHMERLIELSTA